ncbi:MAG: HAD-IIIA family hydrolase [Chitinophagales bacterium]|nr:HAD-IIIA family hydrolase [Chitinophagales bacterium]MCB9020640.1 HAD-IIIA family hydrolase [Chitinophagales bacterium]
MIREVIVLAGGFGTRLASVVQDLPKPMAPVAGKPFLQYILDDLSEQGMQRCILAVGHLRQVIMRYFGDVYAGMELVYSEEEVPLGTGGGIRQAVGYLQGDEAFVINGDTFFGVDLRSLESFHHSHDGSLTLALKKMYRFDRYGTVETDDSGSITAFLEKQYREEGLINGGVYCLHRSVFTDDLPKVFSFEKEVLEVQFREGHLFGQESEAYFIDIGIPEDYERAQTEMLSRPAFDASWTLFLDRDGVLNTRIPGDYVRNPAQLDILSGVPESLAALSEIFGRVVVVTNQQGIGKGLYAEDDLALVHEKLMQSVRQAGGRIDAVFFCPHLSGDPMCDCRKPAPGMAMQAKKHFPEIDFSRSVMVGDAASDIRFGRDLGMYTVAIQDFPIILADESAPTLSAWATSLKQMKFL